MKHPRLRGLLTTVSLVAAMIIAIGLPVTWYMLGSADTITQLSGTQLSGLQHNPHWPDTAEVAVFSCMLGFILWLIVRLLAVRALDTTMARLTLETTRFRAALNNMTQGLCLFDAQHRLVVFNHRFACMFGTPQIGINAKDLLPNQGLSAIFVPPDPMSDLSTDSAAHELSDGRVIQVVRRPIGQEGWVTTYEDITERRRAQERLLHMAWHDALTGLPNRARFTEHLGNARAWARRGRSLAVLCIDLDNFKAINHAHGHAAGDALLCQVARRLRESIRETDFVARLASDEFAIAQVDAAQPEQMIALADRLLVALRQPFDVLGYQIEISASIGIVLADALAPSGEELVRQADIALTKAKAAGRGVCRFFEPGMDAAILRRRRMEADLRLALAEGQFEVFYQPLMDAKTLTLIGFEALIRWHHPTMGLVPPGDFIPLAEETRLIEPIGKWVLSEACAAATHWPRDIKIAVNLSPVQFRNGRLTEEVELALKDSGLSPHRLELEITESVLLQDTDTTLGMLQRMHALGVRISMDDFGTGYSSLSYLRRFPFDKIKIDRSFVHNLGRGKGSIEIIRAMVGLGKALGMDVLAEGVETEQQLAILQNEGCDELQGYLFSKPRPLAEITDMITALAARAAELPGRMDAAGS